MTPQQSIAHYRILSKLGEGGMGAVYRATDTRLNRDVAIKVLPPAFAEDAARMQRFEREAQVLASLNHPNIAAIYGIEQGAIVMELVEGADLAGPLPLDRAIDYARQIAAGLEAAHEKGIIHRDLKPANIKVTPDGAVKLLDFGLAKANEAGAPAGSNTQSPTMSLAMTQAGMILGTAAYMAPEQARGKPVDKRADIWAFGVVLFEMLTGRALFGGGETVTDTIAAVVTREPDWKALPAETPHHVRRLLQRCLRKDPKQRLRDIGEARLALEEPDDVPAIAVRPSSRLPWIAAALALAAAAAGWGFLLLRPKPADPVIVRFPIVLPEGISLRGGATALNVVPSPDGRSLVFVASAEENKPMLWIRPLNSPAARALDRTQDASSPFWSPDNQWIGFFAEGKLKKVPVAGGPPVSLCDLPADSAAVTGAATATWNSGGTIVVSSGGNTALLRVPAAGGPLTPAATLGPAEVRHLWPQFLPDGRHLLYFARLSGQRKGNVYVQELGSAQRVRVMESLYRVAWTPPGYLLIPRDGSLFAQHIDPATFQLTGEATMVADEIVVANGLSNAALSVSPAGVLVYRTVRQVSFGQLAWYGRDGKRLAEVSKPAPISSVRISPDEKSVAVTIGITGRSDLHIIDLASGVLTRMTSDGTAVLAPVAWSPDSQRIAIGKGDGLVELTVASGKTRILSPAPVGPEWSPDNHFVMIPAGTGIGQLSLIPLEGTEKPRLIEASPFWSYHRLSPDGKYVAYCNAESAPPQIFVASFPSFAERRQISKDGGDHATWRADGQELYFRAPNGTLMSVAIKTGAKLEAGIPQPLFNYGGGPLGQTYWPSSDGKRFLVKENGRESDGQTIIAVNWASELRQ